VPRLIYLISLNDNFQIACHVRQSQTQSQAQIYVESTEKLFKTMRRIQWCKMQMENAATFRRL